MTISIDCRHIGASGIGVYLEGCLPHFLKTDNRFLLLGTASLLAEFVRGHGSAEIVDCETKPFSVRELLFFPAHILAKINGSDLYYSPYFNIPRGIKVPIFTTIHDIIFPDMPELTSFWGLKARMWFYRRAERRSAKIFTVSEFSKSRIEHHLGTAKPVIAASGGIQSDFLDPWTGDIAKQKTILFVGNIKKHKGLSTLITAFRAARNEGLEHTLVIIGEKSNFRSADSGVFGLMDGINDGSIEFSGHISNGELKRRLREAALLVQPSLYEGFGFPPLEAMVCGTAALVSGIPVFREIYGGFPVTFFRAGDAADLKEKLLALLYGKDPQKIVLTKELAEKYTFEKTASIIMKELKC